MLAATLAKLGVGVLAAGTVTAVAVPVTLAVTTKEVELIKYSTKDDYERLCREFQQELTVIDQRNSDRDDEKVKLLACPVDKNSNQAAFYIYDLKTMPTKEVEKLDYSDDVSSSVKVTFTLFNTVNPEETYRAHMTTWKNYSGLNLKEKCRIDWGNIEQKDGKEITCPEHTERLRAVNSVKEP